MDLVIYWDSKLRMSKLLVRPLFRQWLSCDSLFKPPKLKIAEDQRMASTLRSLQSDCSRDELESTKQNTPFHRNGADLSQIISETAWR